MLRDTPPRPRPAIPHKPGDDAVQAQVRTSHGAILLYTDLSPRMDLFESPSPEGGAPLVTATFELPGLRKDDVHIEVVERHMIDTSEAEKIEEGEIVPVAHGGYTVREIKRGKFKRVVPLPAGTKIEDIKASMHDGILTVTFPGKTRPKPQYVPVA
ncbi:HSP20-like chaperone [Hysterangium stoloniferum]|nr:HSP20-like chaperone [Hysterangium stoloniferum]